MKNTHRLLVERIEGDIRCLGFDVDANIITREKMLSMKENGTQIFNGDIEKTPLFIFSISHKAKQFCGINIWGNSQIKKCSISGLDEKDKKEINRMYNERFYGEKK